MRILFYLALILMPALLAGQQADDQFFTAVEEMPRFPGCEAEDVKDKSTCSKEKLLHYIYKNLKYPEAARKNKVEGVVVIQFVISSDGSIKDAKLVRDIGSGCGDAALHVVNSMSELIERDTIITFNDKTYEETVEVKTRQLKWTPGFQHGKAVNVLYTLPVKYKLQDDTALAGEDIQEKDKWVSFPPEYQSFQEYKNKVLIPEQVTLAFKVDPVESSKVVGDIIPYGQAMHPLLNVMGTHNGIDFRAVPGVPVLASAEGVVLSTNTKHEKYGHVIKVKHNDKAVSLYAHMSSILVEEGQTVKAGQQIGAVGQSGDASYPHLHYELHINGQTENPLLDTRNSANMHAAQKIHITRTEVTDKPKPLLVIDGIIQESEFDIEELNPDNIETMHVIKGEAAHTKYGSSGEHGVIEIKLKATATLSEAKKSIDLSQKFELAQNVPNPVMDMTRISFHLPTERPASLLFYNQAGEFVYGIRDGLTKGFNEVNVSVSDLNVSGLVYYFLIQDQMTKVKKMVVVQ